MPKGLKLIIDIAPELPRVVGDAKRIGQILINYANNAVKFTERGEIRLRALELARHNGQGVCVSSLPDTGIGIAEDKLPLLFCPFQQLDGSMSRQFEGSELGLAISKVLAELMDGTVGVTSSGRGECLLPGTVMPVDTMPAGSESFPALPIAEESVDMLMDGERLRGRAIH